MNLKDNLIRRHKYFDRTDEHLKLRAPNPYRFKRHQVREKQDLDSPILEANVEEFPETAGIYFLFNYNYHIVYIGQSLNLKKRLKDHLNPKSGNSNVSGFPFTDVAFYSIVDAPTRLFLEAFYIFYYDPEYNYTFYQNSAYHSRQFVCQGANHFRNASPQDIIDLQSYLAYFGEEGLVRIYGKLLFSHKERRAWESIKRIGGAANFEYIDSLRKHPTSGVFPLTYQDSELLLKLKGELKRIFDAMKETYTFQYEMGLIKDGGRP